MVNTLSGSVCAYRKETVKPRFIRIDAVYNSEYINTPTTFEFTKTDITSGAELTGATLTVLDKDGNVVDTWTYRSGRIPCNGRTPCRIIPHSRHFSS